MNLIEQVLEAMQTDDENSDKQSRILKRDYEAATAAQRLAIDNAFICLCGWSLKTLIEGEAK